MITTQYQKYNLNMNRTGAISMQKKNKHTYIYSTLFLSLFASFPTNKKRPTSRAEVIEKKTTHKVLRSFLKKSHEFTMKNIPHHNTLTRTK